MPEEAARSAPPAAQVMAPDMGQSEGGVAEGSLGAMVVVESTGEDSLKGPNMARGGVNSLFKNLQIN